MTHLEKLFSALYLSELWYSLYEWESHWKGTTGERVDRHRLLYYKTRAIVIFDRALNKED